MKKVPSRKEQEDRRVRHRHFQLSFEFAQAPKY